MQLPNSLSTALHVFMGKFINLDVLFCDNTFKFSREADMAGQGVLINSCCPGYTKSDMTGNAKDAPKLPSDAVKTSLWLATMADGSLGPQGCYLADA